MASNFLGNCLHPATWAGVTFSKISGCQDVENIIVHCFYPPQDHEGTTIGVSCQCKERQ